MILMFNQDQAVADWVSKKWGKPLQSWYYAVGILNKEGVLRGAATFHNFNGNNIELCYYGPKTISKDVVFGLCRFIFDHLKATRLTISVPRKNKILTKSVRKMGFKVEGVLRHFYGPYNRDEAIIFGVLSTDSIVKRIL